MLQRDRERIEIVAVDYTTYDISRLVAEEQRRQYLDLVIGLGTEWPRNALPEGGQNMHQVAPEIGEAPLEPKIENDVDQGVAQTHFQRVIAPVGRRVGNDMLGGHGRPDEDEPVMEIRPVQDLA